MTAPNTSGVAEIIEAARISTEPQELALGGFYVVATPKGVETIDLTGDQYRDQPARKTGHVVVRDVSSFAAYWNKHSEPRSEIYADPRGHSITAVLDAHGAADAGWGGHRLILAIGSHPGWEAVTRNNRRQFTQEGFAEWLEDNRRWIVEPGAAALLELVGSFQATTKATFRSGVTLANGAKQLAFSEEVTAGAGGNGKIAIPEEITFGIPVFDTGDPIAERVVARLRYRIEGGKLSLSFHITPADLADAMTAAWEAIVADVVVSAQGEPKQWHLEQGADPAVELGGAHAPVGFRRGGE